MSEIPVVMYHSVNDDPEANPQGFLSVRRDEFAAHLSCLRRNRFRFVTLSELWELAAAGRLDDGRYVALTFDDGFLDNLLVAADVLDFYDARATIFINPDFADSGPVRTAADVPDGWGNLNYAEMRLLQHRGVFEIQSHSMTHNFEFCSDRLVGFYSPAEFPKYYWLAWLLFPADKPNWCHKAAELRERIPVGYPVFEHDRAITARRFTPSDTFVAQAIEGYAAAGAACLDELNRAADKGTSETDEQWTDRVRYELAESKRVLQRELQRPIEFICFPGGAYDERVLDIAHQVGYKAYMVASRKRTGSNRQRLQAAGRSTDIVGLLRMSFTKDFPGFLKNRFVHYLNCKLKIGSYMGSTWARGVLGGLRALRRLGRRR